VITFAVTGIAPEPYALTPTLTAAVRVSADEAVHALALRAQVRIEPLRRRYTDAEAAGLLDLFGPRHRWAQTQRSFLWQHTTAMVPGFSGTTEATLPLPCSYDFEVAASKYLHALSGGTVRLQFLFSGTVFTPGTSGFSVQQIPWDREDDYDMPVAVWRELMAAHFPDAGFVRLRHDTAAALLAYKGARGLLDLDSAVASLLAAVPQEVP